MRSLICSTEFVIPAARRRTSFATMWKFLPKSPALLASSSALNAIILVWSAISLMIFTISQMLPIFSPSSRIPAIVVTFAWVMSFILSRFDWSVSKPDWTFFAVFSAISVTSLILSTMLRVCASVSSIVARISFTPVDCSSEVVAVACEISVMLLIGSIIVFPIPLISSNIFLKRSTTLFIRCIL